MAEPVTNPSEKQEVEQLEREDVDYSLRYGHVKSRWDELTIRQTLWTFKRAVFIAIAVYTGYICEGFELNSSGSVIANAGFIKQFGNGSTGVRALDKTWVSTWSALLNVGQIITFLYIPWFADRFGRKMSFYLAWVWLVVGCIFLNTAKTPSVWALAKLCNGAGVGVLQIVCQVYIMEICPNNIRGGMVTFQLVWSNIGSIIISVMMQQLNKKHPDNYLLAMRILWAPIALIILCWAFVPESPWFYARHGKKEKAIKAMKQLYGGVEGYDYEEEYGIIARTIEQEKEMSENCELQFVDVFKGINRKRTLTVLLMSVTLQLGGLAVINTYLTYFFSLAGEKDPFLASVIVSCCNLIATMLWCFSIDRVGRRMIVCTCQTLVCVLLFVVGGLYWTGASKGNATGGTVLLVICCLWSFFFTIVAMGHYLFSAEIPSAMLRMKTGPIAFFANSILGIATVYATPPMLLSLNLKAVFVFGAFTVPIAILMWIYIPETKARSAAEIDELYERKIKAWRWSKTVTAAEEEMHAVVEGKGVVDTVGQATELRQRHVQEA